MAYLGSHGDSTKHHGSRDDDAAYRAPAAAGDDGSAEGIDELNAESEGVTDSQARGSGNGDVAVLATILTAAVGCGLVGFAVVNGSRPISYVAGIGALAGIPLLLMWRQAAPARRRSIAAALAISIFAVGLAVPWFTRQTPVASTWSVDLTGAPSELMQTGPFVLHDDASGITAIDAATGAISWQIGDAQEIDYVAADGYILATDRRSTPRRKVWISPSGTIEWTAEEGDGQWANGPFGQTDLDLTWPIAAKDGVLVVRQNSPGTEASEPEPLYHYVGLAADGTIVWTVDIPALMPVELSRLDAKDPLAEHVRLLPTVGLVDITAGPGGVVAAYDAATGAQLTTLDVGELYQPGSGEPLGIVVIGDDILWQSYSGNVYVCDIHRLNLADGSTWTETQPCLGVGLQASNGWLTDWVSPTGERRVFRAFKLKTGEALGQPVSVGAIMLFNDLGSDLTALNVNNGRLVATQIAGTAEKWSVAVPDGALLDAGYGDGVVAVARESRATNNPLTSQADLPPSVIDVYDAETGERRGEFSIDVRVHEILPLTATRFLVVSLDSIALYDLG